MRREINDERLNSVVVGLERRLVAFASDDALWQRRRQLTMEEIAERTVAIDSRAGNTTEVMWIGHRRTPQTIESTDVDSWLDLLASGRAVGTSSEATAHHHSRRGIVFRPIKDGPRIPVRLVWWKDAPPRGLEDLIGRVTELYSDAL